MKIIDITTQEEFDALPDVFDEYTQINIRSKANVWITVNKARESSHVEARGSSHVVALGSSHVEAIAEPRIARETAQLNMFHQGNCK